MLNINICIATVCGCKCTIGGVPKLWTPLNYLTYFNKSQLFSSLTVTHNAYDSLLLGHTFSASVLVAQAPRCHYSVIAADQ